MFSLGLIFVRLDYLSVMMEEKYFDFLHIFGFSFVNLIFFYITFIESYATSFSLRF